nr:MAG TPA: hypothetical protein [Caudoviricetes sp.]
MPCVVIITSLLSFIKGTPSCIHLNSLGRLYLGFPYTRGGD